MNTPRLYKEALTVPRLFFPAVVSAVLFFLIAAAAPAATLQVGPNRKFARPCQAIEAARDGDTIEIDAGSYPGDVATILGGNGEMLFEHCEFEHCGPVPNPATHSLYIGERCTRLIFRYNYSTDVIEGHLLKSRAKESWLYCNRITDENGTGSAVADFPNGGVVVVVGNLMHKGARGNNSRVIAYGMEGIKHEKNALCVVNNTMVYDHRHKTAFFVRVENAAENFVPIIRNNLCIGKVPLTNWPRADAAGNLLFQTVAEAGLVDPAHYDYHLQADSPCIGKGVPPGKFDGFDLTPTRQYVHPCQSEPRPTAGPLDVGAYQFGAGGNPTGQRGRRVGQE
jgi:hypothetical protein